MVAISASQVTKRQDLRTSCCCGAVNQSYISPVLLSPVLKSYISPVLLCTVLQYYYPTVLLGSLCRSPAQAAISLQTKESNGLDRSAIYINNLAFISCQISLLNEYKSFETRPCTLLRCKPALVSPLISRRSTKLDQVTRRRSAPFAQSLKTFFFNFPVLVFGSSWTISTSLGTMNLLMPLLCFAHSMTSPPSRCLPPWTVMKAFGLSPQ